MTRTARLDRTMTRTGIVLTATLIGMILMVGAAKAGQTPYPGMPTETAGAKDPRPTVTKPMDKASPKLHTGKNSSVKAVPVNDPPAVLNTPHHEKGSGMATGKR